MNSKLSILCIVFFLTCVNLSLGVQVVNSQNKADRILGKWVTQKKDLIVEVYKLNGDFKAKILWFDDKDDLTRPMNVRTDYQNEDPKLRGRKLLGLEVLKNLTYDQKSNTWENGIIYDADVGREWSSYAYFIPNDILRVKGYWHFKFIGKSMDFERVKQ